MAFVGFNIIGAIGLDLTLKCITAVTTSAQGIYSLVNNISNNKQEPSIGRLLQELDIDADIRILETLLKEFNVNKHHTETLGMCLEGVERCVRDIETLLYEIQLRLDYNKSLWFSFRAYGFTDLIEKLKLLKITLENRKKNLFEIIKINAYLNVDKKKNNKLPVIEMSLTDTDIMLV